jgi:DNA polymerase
MGAWSLNDVKQRQWSPAEGEDMPYDLQEALEDPHVVKWAWNAPFEINIARHVLKLRTPTESWRDTMVLALTCSLPGKLEKAGPVVDLPENQLKDSRGRVLMRKFSSPYSPKRGGRKRHFLWYEAYSDWIDYLAYNDQDETAERGIWHRLKRYMPSEEEWALWHLDQEINEDGIPINMDLVRNAIAVYETMVEDRLKEMQEITGLDNANSGTQLLPWLQDQGYPFDDLKKGHVERALEYCDDPPEHWGDNFRTSYVKNKRLKRVLELRSEASKTSPKKFHALARAVGDDGMLRYAFQFAGAARTWRWGGRLWQPQNLVKPTKALEKGIVTHVKNLERCDAESLELIYEKPMDLVAAGVRPAAQAPDGMVFADADLNAIENRVLGWMTGCDKILRVFRMNRDPYLSFAVYLYETPYDKLLRDYEAGDGLKRKIAKPGTLGCGYMLGPGEERTNWKTGEKEATGLLGYAWNMGIREFTVEQSKLSVETFRREFSEVKDYWYDIERAAKKCIRTGKPVEFGLLRFDRKGPFMRMILPSGRALHYCRPRIEDVKTPWGAIKPTITYEELNDRKQWVRNSTHPGKLTENADQAIARDILAVAMVRAKVRGLSTRIHVHDQLVALVKENRADEKLKILQECLEEPIDWAPGLPLGSAGFISKIFIKD